MDAICSNLTDGGAVVEHLAAGAEVRASATGGSAAARHGLVDHHGLTAEVTAGRAAVIVRAAGRAAAGLGGVLGQSAIKVQHAGVVWTEA